MKTENMLHKIKRFGNDHKKELITGVTVAGGIALTILGYKHLPKKPVLNANGALKSSIEDIPIPKELKVWNTSDLWCEGEYLNAIIQSIPMDDLGKLGDTLIECGLSDRSDVASIIIGARITT